jgi:hypothetical protein
MDHVGEREAGTVQRSDGILGEANTLVAGSEATLERSECEADRTFALAAKLVGLAHFGFHVLRYGLV